MSAAAFPKGSSFYRVAGISYLRYLNLATTAARKAVRPDVRATYGAREQIHYRLSTFAEGITDKRVLIESPKLE